MNSIFLDLKKKLSPARVHHILRVVRTAEGLAKLHGVSLEKARLAAALHDGGKFESLRAQRAALRKYRVSLDPLIKLTPPLWHAELGAVLAKRQYGVKDLGVLRAIRLHTTGEANMTPLDLVIFLADAVEPGRRYPGVNRIRKIARRSLKEAFLEALKSKILHVIGQNRQVHPRASRAWNWIAQETFKKK